MKKVLSVFLSVVLILSTLSLVSIPANAENYGDFKCEILGDGTAEITDYTGSATNLKIPSEIDGYTVTSIGWGAFDNCTSLTSVTIPNSVTSIGDHAFYNTGYYNDESNWENDVLYIGKYLIDAKKTLSGAFTIKNATKTIADYAFSDCDSLTSVTIPNSITSIGDGVFSYCESLTSVTIPNNVTSIGDDAFSDCFSLTSVTIPNSVTSIGAHAFLGCESLTSVTIPDSVTSIGYVAFAGCGSLTNITVESGNQNYSSADGVLFNKEKTELIQYPIGNTRISYVIPDSVTSIGDDAFDSCDSLTSVTIPKSVTSIGERVFWEHCSLTDVYYSGSEDDWNNISIGMLNWCLNSATIHYNVIEPSTQPTVKPDEPTVPSACVHTTVVKNLKKATYFTKGYSGDKVCVKCGVVTAKGKATAKLTLKTPSFKLTKGKKLFKVKYIVVSGATGFQVRYKLKGKWKTKTYKTTKTVTKTIKKLKKGKYSVQVRAFVEQGGKKVYSSWSKIKRVKVK